MDGTVLPVLDGGEGLGDLVRDPLVSTLLPDYLPRRRWFATKNERIADACFAYAVPLPDVPDLMLAEIAVETGGRTDRYVLPVGLAWASPETAGLARTLALATVRDGGRTGLLTDGFAFEALARAILRGLRGRTAVDLPDGAIHFNGTARADALDGIDGARIRWLTAEQSNSSLLVGDLAMVKLIRRVGPGIHPEAEMTRYLTEVGYANTAPLLGEVVRVSRDGTPHTLAIVQGVIANQGDAWTWVLDHLGRASAAADDGHLGAVDAFIGTLGRRLGELHRALASPTDDPEFAPVRAGDAAVAGWTEIIGAEIGQALDALAAGRDALDPANQALADGLLGRRGAVLDLVGRLAEAGRGTRLTRVHGDFHLGQVLVSGDDAYLIDFEGEPARVLDERRAKGSPLRDVAGLLRSVDYAAAAARAASPDRGGTVPDAFRRQATDAFLSSYHVAVGDGSAAGGALLDLMLLEKAAYEIRYEVANRPDWIPIPLRGFADLADRLLKGDGD